MIDELKFLIDIVKEAEQFITDDFDVKTKGGEYDLVTDNDVAVEKFLISKIKQRYPTFDIVSEEYNFDKGVSENCFVIDPIDGTINFANRLPLWVIQIACIKGGETVASVIDIVKLKQMYYADKNGAFLNGEKISIHEVPIKNALFCIDGSNCVPSILRMRKHTSNRRNFGSVGVSMAFVASGKIHGAVYGSNKPWDYVPGLFLIKMAGGSVCDIPGFHCGAMNDEFLKILKVEAAKKSDRSNVFVLHSLNGDTLEYWGQDLKSYLTEREIDIFMPEFPIRAESSYEKFDKILHSYYETGTLNENSIVICHSIANPYFIRFCSKHNFVPKHFVAVAPGAVYEYPMTRTDYIVSVKKQAYLTKDEIEFGKKLENVVCFYSDEDDNNIEKFERFIKDFGAKPMYLKGYNHFDGRHRIYKIPELIEYIDKITK